ncbi:hypothetical protein GOP47_0021756 [Adiantum capillus-veneris]|uniref:TAFII55 protein conserved region domain-containing protein n=1 Tax=Adiantum capillus-veneris TaxID=13818 RepID=A0A9D4U9U0_ADICA|nr:hypothetical protein GOP47_0021756 [Adiantum capillus-veneris]
MEEHFILRVPPSVAERLERVLNENPASPDDVDIDLSFVGDGRTGSFKIGGDTFPAALLDMPCVLETYKTYDDNVLIKTADIGQMIMVRDEKDPVPDSIEYRHGFTPPMRDARRRRFRREPDLNPELVQKVEQDLISIMSGGTAQDILLKLDRCLSIYVMHVRKYECSVVFLFCMHAHVEVLEQEEEAEDEEPIQPPARPPLPGPNRAANEGPSNQNEKSDSEDFD